MTRYRCLQLLCIFLFRPSASASTLSCQPPTEDDIPLPIGVFVPQAVYSNGSLDHSSSSPVPGDFVHSIRLALHHLSQHTCILAGYRLHLTYKSTQCTPSLGVRALFEIIASEPRPIALFGGFCTRVNEAIAMALKYWQIAQLSYAETHPKFASADSQDLYPTFFRIVPGDRNTNEAKTHEKLIAQLEHSEKVTVVYTAGVTYDEPENIGTQLDELKNRDVRIIIMDVDEVMVARVACEIYARDMYGENYVWILPGFHKKRWESVPGANCSQSELDAVLEGHFAVEFATHRKDLSRRLVSGKLGSHVLGELERHSLGVWSAFLYDGLFTLAIALRHAIGADVDKSRVGDVSDFSYHKMLSALNNISFEGLTGRIRFERNERLGLVNLLQYRSGMYQEVATYDGAEHSFNINTETMQNWKVPLDATVVERIRERISRPVLIGFSFLALVGIVLALFFLSVNVKYRNHRFIKMSSPNLNNIIIIGSMFTYISVILLGLDTSILGTGNFVKLCYARTWILSLGFTLAFGSMFSKTWRVHSIFTNIRMDKKAIKDSRLLMMLASLLLIDVIVLSLWAFFSPFQIAVRDLPSIYEMNRVIIPEVETCFSSHSVAFQAVLYVIKGILMILGCFLAWETRHVNIPALNDSKYIGMSVYNVVVMSVLGLSIAFILEEKVNEEFALSCSFIIFCTTLTLCLLFVPKLIELARNPQGVEARGYRRGLMKSVVTKQKPSSPHSLDSEKDVLARVENENQMKHKYLHQKSAQLWDLLEKLKQLGDNQFIQDMGFITKAPGGQYKEEGTK